MGDDSWKTLVPEPREGVIDALQRSRIRSLTGGGASDDDSWKTLQPEPRDRVNDAPESSRISSRSGGSSRQPRAVTFGSADDDSWITVSESGEDVNETPQVSRAPSHTTVRPPRTPSPSGYASDRERQGPKQLAESLAARAEQARGRLFRLLEHLTNEKGEDLEEKINAWEGFGMDYMPRFPKKVRQAPENMRFSRRTFGADIQRMHTALQYFDLLLEEVIRDQKAFKSPNLKKWEQVARTNEQLLRGVDRLMSMLDLPRRRVPRSALPDHARGLETQEARDVRDWLAARDLLNAVEMLWHILNGFDTHLDDSRESEVVLPRGGHSAGRRRSGASSACPYLQRRDPPHRPYPPHQSYYDHPPYPHYHPHDAFHPYPFPHDYPPCCDYHQYHLPDVYPPLDAGPPYVHHMVINDPGAPPRLCDAGGPNLLNLNLTYRSPNHHHSTYGPPNNQHFL